MPFILSVTGHLHMNKAKSAPKTGESRNNLQLFICRAPKKNNDTDAAATQHNSKITLSLNDYTNSVSKLILLNLLGAASTNRAYGFLGPRTAAICS
jgi:hypothetical protein